MKDNNYLLIGLVLLIVVGGLVFFFSTDRAEVTDEEPAIVNDITIEDPMQEDEAQMDEDLMEEQQQTIVEIAVLNPNFSTLATLLQEADLVEALSGEGPFTVFAPTDEAFAKIPQETLSEIRADHDQLTQILTYHVVEGRVLAEDVVNLSSATTLQGSDVSIEVTDGAVMIDDATVTQTDIEGTNGVIHVIDTVLIPE